MSKKEETTVDTKDTDNKEDEKFLSFGDYVKNYTDDNESEETTDDDAETTDDENDTTDDDAETTDEE